MRIIKQNVGVEVDSKQLKLSFQMMVENLTIKIKGSRTFANTPQGFESLQEWIEKKRISEVRVDVTMEATGVYYENLAYYLHDNSIYHIHVVLGNTSKAFFKSLNLKSKTDEIDAKGLGQMGLERVLRIWEPMSKQMRHLKKLTRERLRLTREKTMVINQLHAENASYCPNDTSTVRYEQRLDFLKKQIKEIEEEQQEVVDKDADIKERIKNVCTAKGLGFITVCGVVSELDGFALFKNRNQLVSYAGYDVIREESGSSIKGKPKISKKGNSYIRQMLYMPAMSAAVHDKHHKTYYQRIVEKTNIKMKGNVAIQRKLLLLIYTLFKNNVPYDPQYHLKMKKQLKPKNDRIVNLKTPEEFSLDFSKSL